MKTDDTQRPVYLDHNATTPCDKRVVEAMLPYFCELFGNAANISDYHGWKAKQAVDTGREQLARLINAKINEIVFTSGATESNNLALRGIWQTYRHKGRHIISSSTEHPSILETLKQLETEGAWATLLRPRPDGSLDLDTLSESLTSETILICLMYANNESGVINPTDRIAALAAQHSVLFMSDATQALGKIVIDVQHCPVDILTCSAHKIYGPKGIGALYVRQKQQRSVVALPPQITGGGGEQGIRAGTLNVPGIVGFGKAAELAQQLMLSEQLRLQTLRDQFEARLRKMSSVTINGIHCPRLPHVSNVTFNNTDGARLTRQLKRTLSVSSGSACASASLSPSHVLMAMGLTEEDAQATLRFSFGRSTSSEDIAFALSEISRALNFLSFSRSVSS